MFHVHKYAIVNYLEPKIHKPNPELQHEDAQVCSLRHQTLISYLRFGIAWK